MLQTLLQTTLLQRSLLLSLTRAPTDSSLICPSPRPQSCFSPLEKDTVYLTEAGNATSDVEAVLNLDAVKHTGVRPFRRIP